MAKKKTEATEKKEQLITRTFINALQYNVVKTDDMTVVESITLEKTATMADQNRKSRELGYPVVFVLTGKEEVLLGMPVSQFKELAKPVEKNEESEN